MKPGLVWTLLLLVLAVSVAHAEKPFAAEGLVGELGIDGASIRFRMIGSARLKYMSALPEDTRRQPRQVQWFSVDVVVRIRFSGKAEAAKVHGQLRKLLDEEDADPIQVAVDHPALEFSSDGELTSVNGTALQVQRVRMDFVPTEVQGRATN